MRGRARGRGASPAAERAGAPGPAAKAAGTRSAKARTCAEARTRAGCTAGPPDRAKSGARWVLGTRSARGTGPGAPCSGTAPGVRCWIAAGTLPAGLAVEDRLAALNAQRRRLSCGREGCGACQRRWAPCRPGAGPVCGMTTRRTGGAGAAGGAGARSRSAAGCWGCGFVSSCDREPRRFRYGLRSDSLTGAAATAAGGCDRCGEPRRRLLRSALTGGGCRCSAAA